MGNINFAVAEEAKRHTIGDQILEIADQLANRAEQMARDVDNTLASVSIPADPDPENTGTLEGTWPPLYQELRRYFQRINRSMDQVQSSLARAELP